MTPLAHHIAKQMTIPPKRQTRIVALPSRALVFPLDLVNDIHCFECTKVLDLIFDLCDKRQVKDLDPAYIFLPAPNTWIEVKNEGARQAWLATESDGRFLLKFIVEGKGGIGVEEYASVSDIPYDLQGMLLAALALINTPKVIGRDQFMPNRGLERTLRNQFSGKFPLHAWHELTLHVSKPMEIDDGEPHEAHLTGMRALHFCRSHLRVRLGRVEFVTSHWRGNPALGIKQARYKVVA